MHTGVVQSVLSLTQKENDFALFSLILINDRLDFYTSTEQLFKDPERNETTEKYNVNTLK